MTEADVRDALRDVIDPELGVNIVDLGLVYGIDVDGRSVRIRMTMTSPACPLRDFLKTQVVEAIEGVGGADFDDIEIDIVTEPPWTADRMSDSARRQLGGN
jgi:metal-sulfur cluster biosynthetic enzyme